MSTLIKNATVIAMDSDHGAEPWPADILIEGDSIPALGRALSGTAAGVADATAG